MRRALAALLLALVAACGAAGSSGSKHTAVAVRAPAKVAPNASTRADAPVNDARKLTPLRRVKIDPLPESFVTLCRR